MQWDARINQNLTDRATRAKRGRENELDKRASASVRQVGIGLPFTGCWMIFLPILGVQKIQVYFGLP